MSEILLTAYNGAILGPIAKLLGWVMNGVYYLMLQIGLKNVGLSIIIFTIIVYTLMLPLTYKQQKFSKLSQKMQPELNAINKKYEGKRDQASMMAMQEETKAVYEKYGVSIMGSCGQLLISMPLLLALYRVFINVPAYVTSVKNNFSSLVEGIMATSGYQDKMTALVDELNIYTSPMPDFTVTDTEALSDSVVDVLYKLNTSGWETLKDAFPSLVDTINSTHEVVSDISTFICLNISDTPWEIMRTNFTSHSYLMVIAALLVPVISYLTQVLNMKLMPQTGSSDGRGGNADSMAQQMKTMNRVMPIFSLVMCFTVPVGLGIYWITSALVRCVQQFVLNRHFEKMDLEDIIRKNQEKAKKKREKMGISENQISNAAKVNARQIAQPAAKQPENDEDKNVQLDKEAQLEKANEIKAKAKSGSMAAKANMVREFNEKNSRK